MQSLKRYFNCHFPRYKQYLAVVFRHAAGIKWVLFFQDTNGLLFKASQLSYFLFTHDGNTHNYHLSFLKCRQFQHLWESVPSVNSMSTLLQFPAKQKKLWEELHDLLMLMVFACFYLRDTSFLQDLERCKCDVMILFIPPNAWALTLDHYDRSGRSMVINVEYNQLDPLLRASGYPNGDANCETGYSPFPGNINQVIFCHKGLDIELIFE